MVARPTHIGVCEVVPRPALTRRRAVILRANDVADLRASGNAFAGDELDAVHESRTWQVHWDLDNMPPPSIRGGGLVMAHRLLVCCSA